MHDQSTPVEVKAYGLKCESVESDSKGALAKEVFDPDSGITKYYLKYATKGPEAGKLYNHLSPMFSKDAISKARYEFKRVPKETFELYLKFLQTENPAWVRNAERVY